MRIPALIISVVWCFMMMVSCRTIKTTKQHTSSSQRADTFIQKETTKLDTLRAMADSAKISVPAYLLNDSGINYLERSNGRATVKIQRIKDVIYATAVCDSLEMVIVSKDREIERLRTIITADKTIEKKVVKKNYSILQLCIYGLVFIVLGYLLIRFINYLKPLQWVKTILTK